MSNERNEFEKTTTLLHFLAMALTLALAIVGITGSFAAEQNYPNRYTATQASAVYAAQATAPTYQGKDNYVNGKAFDRFVEIWLENTDYAKAAGDPNLAALAKKGITLSNYFVRQTSI